ncbi:1-acyl-sn-glycerol-3-phosphate acyltransferase [Pedobacter sp. N36a]|uniref:1-acyl-sn-glycerol-3-phosphate acyltransferase n=1 Tax=Pedobacter sp. N36a TaxID=2767996 RepID=UPI0021061F8E|nr:1-acyl-sn-glycerol-3-phosphate acyltransferase [Pedobacter sp. N36a]
MQLKEGEAILLLANHFSWWDGFLMFQLNKVVFKKEFHVLVSEEDYQRRWYLKYLGAFASKVKGKDVVKTLAYAGQLLDDPQNLVLFFPQGKLYTSYVSNISFEKGVMQLINASKKKFQVVFSATLTDYFDKRKPMAKSYLSTWEAEEYISLQLLKREYNKHYSEAIHQQSKKSA